LLDSLINSNLSQSLITFLLAMIPISELRGALLVAIPVFHMPWYQAFYLAVIGNLIPVPFLLLFFDAVSKLIKKNKRGKQLIDWLLSRTAKRMGNMEKYKFAGLMVFVAIPLPLTGAWTACLAAYIMGMPFWKAFLSISSGVLAAGVIVTILALLGWIGAGIAIAGIILVVALGAWKL
jgi:uncharacterized membrane protein